MSRLICRMFGHRWYLGLWYVGKAGSKESLWNICQRCGYSEIRRDEVGKPEYAPSI